MSPETCRSHALECMRLAQDASDPQHRSLLLSMAQSWAVLADSAEKIAVLVDRGEAVARAS